MKANKCRKCKMDIPKGAKICPYCKSKQGSGLGGVLAAIIVIFVFIPIAYNVIVGASRGRSDSRNSPSEPVISEEEYKASCTTIEYEELERNPDKYKGQSFTFTGEVAQVIEPTFGNTVSLRINVTKSTYVWKDTIYATVKLPSGSDRILENDIITIYGDCDGLYTYTSVLNAQVSVPKIDIKYFSLVES